MKKILLSLLFIGVYLSANSQYLDYKKGQFLLDEQVYAIYEISNAVELDVQQQALLQKVIKSGKAKKTFGKIALVSTTCTVAGISGMIYFENNGGAIIGPLGMIFSGVVLVFAGPATMISGSGWLISTVVYKKRVHSFMDSYNNSISTKPNMELGIKLTEIGMGLILSF